MNRRPLDPQNGGVGVFAAQTRSACRTRRAATCGLFGRVHAVWSPSDPMEHEEMLPLGVSADVVEGAGAGAEGLLVGHANSVRRDSTF